MLEAIGIFTIVVIGIVILYPIVTRPNEEEKREQIRKQEQAIEKQKREETEQSLINQYKDLIIELFQDVEIVEKEELNNALIDRYNYNENEAQMIIWDMSSCGLITSWESNEKYSKGRAFNDLNKIFINFAGYSSRMINEGYRDLSFMPNNPLIELDVTSRIRNEVYPWLWRAKIEFGIASQKSAKEKSHLTNIESEYTLYFTMLLAWLSPQTSTPEMIEYLKGIGITETNLPKQYSMAMIPLVFDKSELEYERVYNGLYNRLLRSEFYYKLIGSEVLR